MAVCLVPIGPFVRFSYRLQKLYHHPRLCLVSSTGEPFFSNANLNFKQWCKFFYLLQSFNGDRCMKRDEADRCSTQFVVDPQVLIQLIEDNPLAEAQKSEDPIQLRPQRVSMSNARKGNIKSFFKTKKNSWNVWLRNRSILYDSGWIQAS